MHAVPGALREASYGLGARRRDDEPARRVPRRRVRHRGGADPRHLAGDRRDDGRGDRGRRDRAASPASSTRWSPGQTMTAAMASLATGSDQVAAVAAARVPQPVLRRAPAVPHHLRAQRGERAVRATGAEAVLMAAGSRRVGDRSQTSSAALTGKRRDVRGHVSRWAAARRCCRAGRPRRAGRRRRATAHGPCLQIRGADFLTQQPVDASPTGPACGRASSAR